MNTRPIVFLDLDDTLLDFRKAEALALSKTLKELDIEPSSEIIARYSEINRQQWELLEKGLRSRDEILTARFELLFGELGIAREGAAAREIYEGRLAQGHFFIEGAEALLEALHGRYALYIASNGTAAVQAGRIESAGLARFFEGIFISEELGFNKPDARFFERCFEKIDRADRERAIIVGDSLSSDIQGGRNAGIKSCWFNPGGKPAGPVAPDFCIAALSELPPLLECIFSS